MHLASLSTCFFKKLNHLVFIFLIKKCMLIVEILENIENYKQHNKSDRESYHLEITRTNGY